MDRSRRWMSGCSSIWRYIIGRPRRSERAAYLRRGRRRATPVGEVGLVYFERDKLPERPG
jgi:hypothetical protein